MKDNELAKMPVYNVETKGTDFITRGDAVEAVEISWISVEYTEDMTKPEIAEAAVRQTKKRIIDILNHLTPVTKKSEVLEWLLHYHRQAFGFYGKYSPHEVVGWLINDFCKDFSNERDEE